MDTPRSLNTSNRLAAATATSQVIRTPDQRVRVFVSSTLDELAAERAAAREAITQLRLTPVLFESGPRPPPPRQVYPAFFAPSRIFLGLFLHPHGMGGPAMVTSCLDDRETHPGASNTLTSRD